MSAPSSEVVDRLDRLADRAPRGALDPDAIWARGRRRQRMRASAALAVVVVVGLLGMATTPQLVEHAQQVTPAESGDRTVLPAVLRQPGGWEPAFPRVPGRLSAVGVGTRSGLWSSTSAWWGVAAATGDSRFLDLPDVVVDAGEPALSADGRMLAYWVSGPIDGEPLSRGATAGDVEPVVGVAVMDLESGEREVWEVGSSHGLYVGGMAWAGDVLWWSAGAARQEENGGLSARLRVRTWNWRTGERNEPTGNRPGLGTDTAVASDGFVEQWRRRRLTRVVGGAEPTVLRIVMPAGTPDADGITQPAISTDGSRVAALLMADASRYDDAPQPLLVGVVDGREVELEQIGLEEQGIVGWRSPTEVVVTSQDDVGAGRAPRALRAWVVDVTTGERTELLQFSGNTPQVAADAWGADVVPAPAAPFAPDPRLVGAGLIALAFVAWLVVVRVRRRREHP